jgi:hypothetical protein
VTVISVFAGLNDWLPYRGPDKDIITLMMTGNFAKSRLMADLIQNENKQPYILLPASGKGRIFFCPSGKRKALEILEKDLARFIKFVNPKQIIVIGNKHYVPQKYLDKIDPNQTVIIIKNKNWNIAAERIARLLDLSNLASDYKKLYEKLEGGSLYKPTTMNGVPVRRNQVPVVITEEVELMETNGEAIEEEEIQIKPLEPDTSEDKEPAGEKEVKPEKTSTPVEPEMATPEKEPVIIDEDVK